MQVAKTPSDSVMGSLPLFVALCDHNPLTIQTDRQTDGCHASSIIACRAEKLFVYILHIYRWKTGIRVSLPFPFRVSGGLPQQQNEEMLSVVLLSFAAGQLGAFTDEGKHRHPILPMSDPTKVTRNSIRFDTGLLHLSRSAASCDRADHSRRQRTLPNKDGYR